MDDNRLGQVQSGEDGGSESGDRRVATDIAEVLGLVVDEGSDDAEILNRLETIAARYSVDELFAVISRFDTPDILG